MRVVMMGTGLFAEPTFEAVLTPGRPWSVVGLFTQPDREGVRERGTTRQTGRGMKVIAQEHGVPVFQPESINEPAAVEQYRALAPDLAVVAAYGHILKADALAVPTLATVNVHASLLPKYRGSAPIQWAIYHGETRTGVTLFRITRGVDTGDMLLQEAIDVGPDETAGEVEQRLSVLGARLALRVVEAYASGSPPPAIPQDHSQATKAPKLTKEHGVIDWSRRAEQIICQVRAMSPWPTAYTYWHREGQPPLRLIVHRATARLSAAEEAPLAPGEVKAGHTASLCVGSGDGTVVEVTELQPAGKPRMKARDFLNGRRPMPGDRLGPEMA